MAPTVYSIACPKFEAADMLEAELDHGMLSHPKAHPFIPELSDESAA